MAFETNVKGKVELDFSKVTDKAGLGVGKHLVQVQKIMKKEGQDSEYPYLEWTLEGIAPAASKGKTTRMFTGLDPDELWKLRNVVMALLEKDVPKSSVSLDFSKLLGRKLVVEIAERENRKKPGEKFNKVVGQFAPSTWAAPAASVTDEDEVDGEESATELGEEDLG